MRAFLFILQTFVAHCTFKLFPCDLLTIDDWERKIETKSRFFLLLVKCDVMDNSCWICTFSFVISYGKLFWNFYCLFEQHLSTSSHTRKILRDPKHKFFKIQQLREKSRSLPRKLGCMQIIWIIYRLMNTMYLPWNMIFFTCMFWSKPWNTWHVRYTKFFLIFLHFFSSVNWFLLGPSLDQKHSSNAISRL